MSLDLPPTFRVGDTKNFVFSASIDNVTWNFAVPTLATVTLFLLDPNGVLHTKAATVSGVQASVFDSPSTLTLAGYWRRWWSVSQSGVTLTSLPVRFLVEGDPVGSD